MNGLWASIIYVVGVAIFGNLLVLDETTWRERPELGVAAVALWPVMLVIGALVGAAYLVTYPGRRYKKLRAQSTSEGR